MMSLPFTRDQFLAVFAAYNNALWPFAITLWLLTLAALACLGRNNESSKARAISVLLAVHWLWVAVAYHAAFFSVINPAAWLFSTLCLAEAGLLTWHGVVRRKITFESVSLVRRIGSRALVAYGLLYPAVVWADGLRYPWMPTFGVPCPTTILTIGFLIAAGPPVPASVVTIPIVWSGIAGSAAFLLDVRADLMLLVAGAVLTIDWVVARLRASRSSSPLMRHLTII